MDSDGRFDNLLGSHLGVRGELYQLLMVLNSGYLIPSTEVIQFTITLKITPHSLSKSQSLSITVVSRTTFTPSIILHLVMK